MCETSKPLDSPKRLPSAWRLSSPWYIATVSRWRRFATLHWTGHTAPLRWAWTYTTPPGPSSSRTRIGPHGRRILCSAPALPYLPNGPPRRPLPSFCPSVWLATSHILKSWHTLMVWPMPEATGIIRRFSCPHYGVMDVRTCWPCTAGRAWVGHGSHNHNAASSCTPARWCRSLSAQPRFSCHGPRRPWNGQ